MFGNRFGHERAGNVCMKPRLSNTGARRSIAQACEWLSADEGARLLAGGESLIPAMNLRLAAPAILIDITGLEELRGVTVARRCCVGALVAMSDIMQRRD